MAKLAWILCTNLPIKPRNLGTPTVFFGALGSGLCRSRTVSCPADLFINHLLFLLSAPTAACNGQMYPSPQSPTSEGDDQASLSHFFFLCAEWTVIPEVFKNDLNPEKKCIVWTVIAQHKPQRHTWITLLTFWWQGERVSASHPTW